MDDALPQILPDVIRYARLRGLQTADAQDVAQEVALRALTKPPTLSLRTWCHHVARNLITDRYRRQSSSGHQLGLLAPLTRDHQPDPADTSINLDDLTTMTVALLHIDPHHADVIRLIDLEGRPTKQVAADLGLKPNTVAQTHRRALIALRSEYLRRGGSIVGFALLVPALRRLARLRTTMIGATASAAVALAMIASPGLPHAQATTPAPAQYRPATVTSTVQQPPGTPRAARASRPRWHQHRVRTVHPHAGTPHPAAITLPFMPDCKQPSSSHLHLCQQNGTDPTLWAVGIHYPTPVCADPLGCSTGLAVSQDILDTSGICPIVRTVPSTICRKGT